MFDDINKRLHELSDGIFRSRKIRHMTESLKKQLFDLERQEMDLKSRLKKEITDVTKLEKLSLAGLFYTALGTLQKHLEKEKKEEFAASLKLSQCRTDIQNIKNEIAELLQEDRQYQGFEEDYEKLYQQKLELLRSTDSAEFLQKSHELEQEISGLKSNLKEINEAVSAGNQVVASLNNAVGKLDSAETAGFFDLVGGGLVTDLIKHSNIDEAKEYVQLSQTLLRRFKSELADIKICDELNICTNGFAKFADFFFDGLIADWYMQSKIKESRESILRVKENVRKLLGELENMRGDIRQKISVLEQKLETLVLTV